jgi:uncharacterized protein YifN (PemK superfamily)
MTITDDEDDEHDEQVEEESRGNRAYFPYAPGRGRIIIVNFEMSGSGVPPEMRKAGRPCVVVQNNKLKRGRLVTIVPLSTGAPNRAFPCHHEMDHRSFRDWPVCDQERGRARWAKCDFLTTVSLDRCKDPSYRQAQRRRYVKVKVIKSDMEAIDRCVLWALGINP